jgi:hypothetical protein
VLGLRQHGVQHLRNELLLGLGQLRNRFERYQRYLFLYRKKDGDTERLAGLRARRSRRT